MRDSKSKKNEKFVIGLNKTGFGLEFSISEILKNSGWTVINNKYYIDDVHETAREIDIIAYKSSLESGVQVYTVLVISCKKSDDKTWCLLAKDKNENDPNTDWSPVTLWSNHNILGFMINHCDWKSHYVKHSKKLKDLLLVPEKHIFAFQELNTQKGTSHNDKAIFNSVVTAMKSQDYELRSLDKRKKENSLYNFNLLSVVDAPLIRAHYRENIPKIEDLESDIYVGSYIVNKKESVARVHFVKSSLFESILSLYEELHRHNSNQRLFIEEMFFKDCVKDRRKTQLFASDFSKKTYWDCRSNFKECGVELTYEHDFSFYWNKNENLLEITVPDTSIDDKEIIKTINNDRDIKKVISNHLREFYRYVGDFRFTEEIPF